MGGLFAPPPPPILNRVKLVSAIFYQIFISHQIKNFEKCFLFHLKSSFRSQNIQFFVFHLPLFFSLPAIALVVDRR